MELASKAVKEAPGAKWQALFRGKWRAYTAWYVAEGIQARPMHGMRQAAIPVGSAGPGIDVHQSPGRGSQNGGARVVIKASARIRAIRLEQLPQVLYGSTLFLNPNSG